MQTKTDSHSLTDYIGVRQTILVSDILYWCPTDYIGVRQTILVSDRLLTDSTHSFHFFFCGVFLSLYYLWPPSVLLHKEYSPVACCSVAVSGSGRSKTYCFPQLGCLDRGFESHSLFGCMSELVLWFCCPVQAEDLWRLGHPSSMCLWTDAWAQKIENWTILTCSFNRQCTEEEQ
jgi:hypothetical protein